MPSEIARLLSKYVEITEELESALSEVNLVRQVAQGTVLLKEGQLCNECYFILGGLMRTYYQRDADEVTSEFFGEGQVASPSCYGTGVPSKVSLECLEDTVAFVGTPELESAVFSRYPRLVAVSQAIGEKMLSTFREDFDAFKRSSPKDRYLNLVKNRPDLLQRVPQYQIASYLGMTPETLSRIRRRLAGKR